MKITQIDKGWIKKNHLEIGKKVHDNNNNKN